MEKAASTYKRHQPEETTLYQVIADNVNTFFDMTRSDDSKKPLPRFVRREFEKYLACGILSHGFVRVKCSECRESMVCGFSCKCRGFCPSCAARRMSQRAIHLIENVLPWVPIRQWVLSVPFELRYWMAADNKLLKKVNKIVTQEMNNHLRKRARALGLDGCQSGYISFLQRAGSALNLNLHFHILAIDGFYVGSEEEGLCFQRVGELNDQELQKVLIRVSRRVIKHLRKIGKLSATAEEVPQDALASLTRASVMSRIALGKRAGQPVRRIGGSFGYEGEKPLMRGYLCGSMNGFSIHAATSIKAHERDKLKNLIGYVGRGALSQERISLTAEGEILYELKNSYDGATHVLFSPPEFLEKLASIIPPPYRHQVTYYGCLSSHSNLRPLVVGTATSAEETEEKKEPTPTDQMPQGEKIDGESTAKTKKSSYIDWQTLLKKVFKIDITICPKCQGRLRIIAVINEKKIIKKILEHMGLDPDPPPVSPSRFYAEDI